MRIRLFVSWSLICQIVICQYVKVFEISLLLRMQMPKFLDVSFKPFNILIAILLFLVWHNYQQKEQHLDSLRIVCTSYSQMLRIIRDESTEEMLIRFKTEEAIFNSSLNETDKQIALNVNQKSLIKECRRFDHIGQMPTPQQFRVIPTPFRD